MKNNNINWNEISIKLSSGEYTKIEQFATLWGVSRPTAKKMLATKYGSQILFNRGRSGGIVFAPATNAQPAT